MKQTNSKKFNPFHAKFFSKPVKRGEGAENPSNPCNKRDMAEAANMVKNEQYTIILLGV